MVGDPFGHLYVGVNCGQNGFIPTSCGAPAFSLFLLVLAGRGQVYGRHVLVPTWSGVSLRASLAQIAGHSLPTASVKGA